MLTFWILAAVTAALAGLLVMAAARRAATSPSAPSDVVATVELGALDHMRERGLIAPDSYAEARAEAGRRLLSASRAAPAPVSRAGDARWVAAGLAAAVLAAGGLYLWLGRPGLPDQPFERRVDDWSERPQSLEPGQLAAVVERVARDQPDDPMVLAMLGAARFEAGDAVGAASAFRRLLGVRPDDAQAWARLGESLTRAGQGQVGADAEAAFRRAVRLDPDQLGARYFLGEAALARGDDAEARAMWGPVIDALDPADPRRADLLGRLAGPPAGAAG